MGVAASVSGDRDATAREERRERRDLDRAPDDATAFAGRDEGDGELGLDLRPKVGREFRRKNDLRAVAKHRRVRHLCSVRLVVPI